MQKLRMNRERRLDECHLVFGENARLKIRNTDFLKVAFRTRRSFLMSFFEFCSEIGSDDCVGLEIQRRVGGYASLLTAC